MNVNFIFKRDVTMEGRRYICAKVAVHQPAVPGTGLWGNTKVDIWIPVPPNATMEELREAALSKAQERAREFLAEPRAKMTFVSGVEF